MSKDEPTALRHTGRNHSGPARTSPYPTSRLAPAHDLVDTARQIAEADHMIGAVVHGKLEVIAQQIRALQAQARQILEQAQHDGALHRAECRFQKRAGHTYHLYERDDGDSYLSMIAPEQWRGGPPHRFLGSFRLQADMSWVAADAPAPPATEQLVAIAGLRDDT